jgi:hypothetical protein
MKEKRFVLAPSDHQFAFYHQNEPLLIQFLLHECLRACQILKKKPSPDLLLQVLGNLDCASETWHAPFGHLPRLLHYSALLTTHYNNPSSPLCEQLGATLKRAFAAAKRHRARAEGNKKGHAALYTSLRKEMLTFMKLLFEKIDDFHNNASVLLFLLRHQEQFDAFYKAPIIKKKFHAFFPDGMKQAQSFLVEKLSKKGCNHLIPYIEQKLKNLDKDGK